MIVASLFHHVAEPNDCCGAQSHVDVITARLPPATRAAHPSSMFMVNEADAAAIRAAYFDEGELSAAIELRRRFPGIVDNARARECARTIAGWRPELAQQAEVTPLRPRKRRQSTTT